MEQTVELKLSLSRSLGTALEARYHLAWRVRIAATLAKLLAEQHTTFQLHVQSMPDARQDSRASLVKSANGQTLKSALAILTDVPLDAYRASSLSNGKASDATNKSVANQIVIDALDAHGEPLPPNQIRLSYQQSPSDKFSDAVELEALVTIGNELPYQLLVFLKEVSFGKQPA